MTNIYIYDISYIIIDWYIIQTYNIVIICFGKRGHCLRCNQTFRLWGRNQRHVRDVRCVFMDVNFDVRVCV